MRAYELATLTAMILLILPLVPAMYGQTNILTTPNMNDSSISGVIPTELEYNAATIEGSKYGDYLKAVPMYIAVLQSIFFIAYTLYLLGVPYIIYIPIQFIIWCMFAAGIIELFSGRKITDDSR